jgi:uncharacterized protein YlxW (UPF0749 family)
MTRLETRLRGFQGWQVTLFVSLLVLGFLIAAQVRSEGPRVRYTTQERSPLVETVVELQSEQEALKGRILELNERIRTAQQATEGSAQLVGELNRQLEEARIAAGLVALEGSGIVLQLDDSTAPGVDDFGRVTGRDVRVVLEELWLAGAEALAVNGERITTSSAVVDIGGSILINSAYLAPPYQIVALGPDDLFDRLSESAGFVDFLRARSEAYGIGVSVAEPDSVIVPAYAGTVNLRFARPGDEDGS